MKVKEMISSIHNHHNSNTAPDPESNRGIDETAEIKSNSRFENGVARIKNRRRNHLLNCFGRFSDEKSITGPTRVYQVWPGKNVFFFHGRIMCGSDPRGLLLTAISIFLSDWIFCSYIDDIPPKHSTLIFALSSIFTLTAIVSLILASTRDPGIIPRSEQSPLEEGRMRSRRINIDDVETKLKYCKICMIFRLPRSCHCSVCDNCVEKFDHHCPWIGQCIGLRNYRYYMMFLFSAFVFFMYMFGFSWWRIRKKMFEKDYGVFESAMNMPETFGLLFFSFFAIWFVGGLAIYHAYLIIINQTARENFKHRYAKSANPYDKGTLYNIKEALFVSLPPSRVNFREVVRPKCDSVSRLTSMDLAHGVDEYESLVSNKEELKAVATQLSHIQNNKESEHSLQIELEAEYSSMML